MSSILPASTLATRQAQRHKPEPRCSSVALPTLVCALQPQQFLRLAILITTLWLIKNISHLTAQRGLRLQRGQRRAIGHKVEAGSTPLLLATGLTFHY